MLSLIKKYINILLLIKIFLVGLMLHFFLYNIVNFSLGVDFQPIWAWKEILILIFVLIFLFYLIKSSYFKQFIESKTILVLEISFVIMILLSFFSSYFINNMSIGTYVMAFKYDFLGFFIFFLFYHLSFYFQKDYADKIIKFYGKFIKICLVLAIFWYAVISIKPGALKYFGYDRNLNEGSLNERPPAVYLTQMNHGWPRNQFLFERPITFGFWLVSFWPLFYVLYLRKKPFQDNFQRRFLYGFNIISTFSRASWLAWIVEILILGFMDYRKNIKGFLLKVVLPIVIFITALTSFLFNDIVMRYFSNSGHIALLKEGTKLFMENPILGLGASTAGPGSHWLCSNNPSIKVCQEIHEINSRIQDPNLKGLNTENQYLQILVEFGLLGFVFWGLIFGVMGFYGIYVFFKSSNKKLQDIHIWYLIGLSIGIFGLAIEGLVLHSFVDRMFVYPIMLIYGVVFGFYIQNRKL